MVFARVRSAATAGELAWAMQRDLRRRQPKTAIQSNNLAIEHRILNYGLNKLRKLLRSPCAGRMRDLREKRGPAGSRDALKHGRLEKTGRNSDDPGLMISKVECNRQDHPC